MMKTIEEKIEEQKRILEKGDIQELLNYAFGRMGEKGANVFMEEALNKITPPIDGFLADKK